MLAKALANTYTKQPVSRVEFLLLHISVCGCAGELLSDVTCLHELSSDDTAVVLVITQEATPPTSAKPPAITTPPTTTDELPNTTEARETAESEAKEEETNSPEGREIIMTDNKRGRNEQGEESDADDGRSTNIEGGVSEKVTNDKSDNETSVKSVRIVSTTVDQEGEKEEVHIKVYDCSVAKPFLGGYRQRATQLEYHNASAQTHSKPRPHDKVCSLLGTWKDYV